MEKTVEKGIAPKSEVAIVFSGPFEYDDAHRLALRTMALVLQSRLLDTIRQELGGHLQHHGHAGHGQVPAAAVHRADRLDVRSGAHRHARAARVRRDRVRQGHARSRRGQVALIRETLLREFERNSQDNGYLLNQISRRYEEGGGADIAAALDMRERIAALTGDAIQQAAQTYLDTGNYVKVTLMPEKK